jgi:hypothetical protein
MSDAKPLNEIDELQLALRKIVDVNLATKRKESQAVFWKGFDESRFKLELRIVVGMDAEPLAECHAIDGKGNKLFLLFQLAPRRRRRAKSRRRTENGAGPRMRSKFFS